ncbi:hypothetical protein ACIO87_28920 [Streptomyces sp. NPDC087218]|uniref:hypothetical protein n=1 Tax=Streptomyces sp. NPDC087218 TaxID=3365769 RepID=UPI0037FA0B6C
MAMVGLFWIAEGDVYLGAKPTGLAPGVRLTPEGVMGLGDGQSTLHLWEDVRALTLADVPMKSFMRQAGKAGSVALETVMNLVLPERPLRAGEAPPAMTLHVSTDGGDHRLTAYTAAASGYSSTEAELSGALLSRLTEGAATMSTTLAAMSDWGRRAEGGSPRGAERERLLRQWADQGS